MASGKSESPDVTVVALWGSLQAIRASENNLFLTQAISRFLACCDGLPHITEQELLASDFRHEHPCQSVIASFLNENTFRTRVTTSGMYSLQLRVFGFCSDEDRNVGVSVFPQREEFPGLNRSRASSRNSGTQMPLPQCTNLFVCV